jgi:dolichyl-phosphate mannosyltransferase polypeptide 3
MATQLSLFAAYLSPFAILWLMILTDVVPYLKPNKELILFAMPMGLVALLGVYAIFSVVYGVLTFNDCVKARADLVAEITEAKKDLQSRGIDLRKDI